MREEFFICHFFYHRTLFLCGKTLELSGFHEQNPVSQKQRVKWKRNSNQRPLSGG